MAGPFIGAPFAAILLESLIAWNVREILFFGWCGAISKEVHIGDIIVPDRSFMDDGTSRGYTDGTRDAAVPAAGLQSRVKTLLVNHNLAFHEGPVWSTDAIFRETPEKVMGFRKKGALAVDMEAAAVFSVGNFRNVDVGCILVVSDEMKDLKWRPGFTHKAFKKQRQQIADLIFQYWA